MIDYDEINRGAKFLPLDGAGTWPMLSVGGADVSVGWADGVLRVLVAVDTGEIPAELESAGETIPMEITVNGETVFQAD